MRFRGSLDGLRTRCLRFEKWIAQTVSQDSLPAAGCALPGGIRPAGFGLKGFRLHCFLLSQAYPGAIVLRI